MKKIVITLFASFFIVAMVRAQNIADGIKDLYAERYKSAAKIFEQNLSGKTAEQGYYWLTQTFFKEKEIAKAVETVNKGLAALPESQLLKVAKGGLDLSAKKTDEATQAFESAITATRTKKGDNPEILAAIGRAITNVYTSKNKLGNITYAIEKLEAAATRDPKNTDILLTLAEAYRKAKPGENGGLVIQTINKATTLDPKLAIGFHRAAKIYESQKNWEVYRDFMKSAIDADPRFAPAQFDMYEYYLLSGNLEKAEAYANKFMEAADPDPNHEYLKAQTLFVKKDYDAALKSGKSMLQALGDDKAKPNVFKLIAYCYVELKDTLAAKQYIDKYFQKQVDEEILPKDYTLKATIYSAIPGSESIVVNSIIEGVNADTSLDGKMDILKEAASSFRAQKKFKEEAAIDEMIIKTKPSPILNDYYYATAAHYSAGNYTRSNELSNIMIEKFPTEIYGYQFKLYNAQKLDTAKTEGLYVDAATKFLDFTGKDPAKYESFIHSTSYYLAVHYYNLGDYANAIKYFTVAMDSTKDQGTKDGLKANIDKLAEHLKKNPEGAKQSDGSKSPGAGSK